MVDTNFYIKKQSHFRNNLAKNIKREKNRYNYLGWIYEDFIEKFIRAFDKSIINIHPSLLPKYRGLDTFARVLGANEKKLDAQFIMLMKNWMKVKLYLENFFFIKKKGHN